MASAALAQECVKHAFIHVHVPLARSEPSKSCQSSDWVDYPGDEDHALRAHAILGLVRLLSHIVWLRPSLSWVSGARLITQSTEHS